MRSNNYRRLIDLFVFPDKEKERYKGMDEKIKEYRDANGIKTNGELFFQAFIENKNYRDYGLPKEFLATDYRLMMAKVVHEWKAAMKNNYFRLFDIGEFTWKL